MKDKNEIGKIIATARKNKRITQQEFANSLNVSDKAVSNWETGKNYPDLVILKDISDILEIDINELLINKGKEKKDKSYFKIIMIAVITLVILLIIILGLFFINNFNKVKIYEIELDSENYKIKNSYLMINNEEVILNIGELYLLNNDTYNPEFNVVLYKKIDNEKKVIIAENKYHNIEIVEDFDDKKNNELSNNLDSFYIEIKYKNNENVLVKEDIKINFKKIFSNNKLVYLKNKSDSDDSYDINQINLLKNNGYVKNNDDCYIKYKFEDGEEFYFTYDLKNKIFTLEKEKYLSKIDRENKIFSYNIYDENNIVTEKFLYDETSTEAKCDIGTCLNSKKIFDEIKYEYRLLIYDYDDFRDFNEIE